jgi:(heptosyl)LPS beta-1,4-glucosyltransferase
MSADPTVKVTLGVVAICRNEERDLPAFLEHLLSWVDEIILVDDGSTDRTVELAQNAGPKVRILSSPRQPDEESGVQHDFGRQRNKGIEAGASDWLLHMDIDERVTPQLRDEILQAIRDSDKDAYSYHRFNFFLHRPIHHGSWARYRSLRLARREFLFGGKIHERLVMEGPKSRIGKLKTPMWHYNEPAYELRLRKNFAYTVVEAEILLDKNKRITVWHLFSRPLIEFIKTYILLLGFRDGIPGLILAVNSFSTTFNAYALAWDAQNRISRKAMEDEFAQLK